VFGGSLLSLGLRSFVFRDDGRRPYYVRLEYMTDRARREGPPLGGVSGQFGHKLTVTCEGPRIYRHMI
jgi:hypothetical protein